MPSCQNSQVSLVSNPQARLQPQVALHRNKTLFFTTRPKTPSCSRFTSISLLHFWEGREKMQVPPSPQSTVCPSPSVFIERGRFPQALFVCLHKTRSSKNCLHHPTMGVYSKNIHSLPPPYNTCWICMLQLIGWRFTWRTEAAPLKICFFMSYAILTKEITIKWRLIIIHISLNKTLWKNNVS